jgi:hypothetical protein
VRPHLGILSAVLMSGVCLAQPLGNCTHRSIVVNVRDRQGKLVVGLPENAFRGEFRGKPVSVKSAKVEIAPRRTLILLDLSSSVTGTKANWEMAKQIAEDLASFDARGNSLALMTFASDVLDVEDFSKGPATVLERLRAFEGTAPRIPKRGRQTALLDALLRATDIFGEPEPGDAIYLISDGGENHSKARVEDVKRVLLRKGIRVYSFELVVPRNFPTEEERLGPQVLQDLAQTTGGTITAAERPFGVSYDLTSKWGPVLAAALNEVYDEMRNFYQLEIELPAEVDKPRKWKLEVVKEQGGLRKNATIIYPHELVPCSNASGTKQPH